jgi:hypothetical protein
MFVHVFDDMTVDYVLVDFSMQQSDGAHNPQSYHQTHGQTWLQEATIN